MNFIRGCVMYVRGVGNKHSNVGKRRRFWNDSTHKTLYFYDEDGSFHTKRLGFWQTIRYKYFTRKVKVIHDK